MCSKNKLITNIHKVHLLIRILGYSHYKNRKYQDVDVEIYNFLDKEEKLNLYATVKHNGKTIP